MLKRCQAKQRLDDLKRGSVCGRVRLWRFPLVTAETATDGAKLPPVAPEHVYLVYFDTVPVRVPVRLTTGIERLKEKKKSKVVV